MGSILLFPNSVTKRVGDIFGVDVRLYVTDLINAAQINISFPGNILTVNSIDYTNSVMGIQAESLIGVGFVRMARGILPGGSFFLGEAFFGRLNFRVIGEGEAFVNIDQTSQLLRAADTVNVLKERIGGYFWCGKSDRAGLNTVLDSTIISFNQLSVVIK